MSGRIRSILVSVLGLGVMACSGGDDSVSSAETETSSIRLELSTITLSGNTYRLGPATFDISDGTTALSVEATGDEPIMHVPVDPGVYEVTLRADWVLQLLDPVNGPTPMTATLVSSPSQSVFVEPFRSAPLTYAFHLGASGIDIDIHVEEGVPPGYGAILLPLGDGRFILEFAGGGAGCCFVSLAEAQESYPGVSIFFPEN